MQVRTMITFSYLGLVHFSLNLARPVTPAASSSSAAIRSLERVGPEKVQLFSDARKKSRRNLCQDDCHDDANCIPVVVVVGLAKLGCPKQTADKSKIEFSKIKFGYSIEKIRF